MVNDVDEVSGEAASSASTLKVVELVKGVPAEWRGRYVPCEHIAERLGVSGSARDPRNVVCPRGHTRTRKSSSTPPRGTHLYLLYNHIGNQAAHKTISAAAAPTIAKTLGPCIFRGVISKAKARASRTVALGALRLEKDGRRLCATVRSRGCLY